MDYKEIVTGTFRSLLILYLALLILDYLDIYFISFYINIDNLLYLVIVFGITSFLFYTKDMVKSRLDKINKFVTVSFFCLFCLIILDQIVPFEFLQNSRSYLMMATIILVALVFLLNRDKINFEDELEVEIKKLERERERIEAKRKEEMEKLDGEGKELSDKIMELREELNIKIKNLDTDKERNLKNIKSLIRGGISEDTLSQLKTAVITSGEMSEEMKKLENAKDTSPEIVGLKRKVEEINYTKEETEHFFDEKIDELKLRIVELRDGGEKRKEEFPQKFPKISGIPILRNIVKWLYKRGSFYSIALIVLVITGFFLRVWNLDFLSPSRDEYYHLVGAKRFILEGTFNYSRGDFLTYIIGFLFRLNGDTSLFLGRLPSVIFGTLSIIAIYFLAKKINKNVGIISAYLLTFSPLAIGLSRFARFYQAYFLFILLYLVYSVYLLENIKNFSSWWEKNKITFIIKFSIIFLPAIYYIYHERAEAFLILYLILGIFTMIFLMSELQKREGIITRNKNVLSLFIVLFIVFSALFVPTFLNSYDWLLRDEIGEKEERYEDALFKPDWDYVGLKLQWFSGSNFTKQFAIFLFAIPILFTYKNKQIISNYLAFLIIFIAFTYVIDRYFAPRYIYYAIPFYITIYACSISIILKLSGLFNNKSKFIYLLLVSVLLFSFFNPITAVYGLIEEKNGEMNQKTNFVHRDIDELFKFLNANNFSEDDVLISANSNIFMYYYNYDFVKDTSDWPLKRFDYKKDGEDLTSEFIYDYGSIYHYYYSISYQHKCKDKVCDMDEMERMSKIIGRYDSGWIVVDKDRNRHWNEGFPLSNFSVDNINVVYLGETKGYRGFDIYRWMEVAET